MELEDSGIIYDLKQKNCCNWFNKFKNDISAHVLILWNYNDMKTNFIPCIGCSEP